MKGAPAYISSFGGSKVNYPHNSGVNATPLKVNATNDDASAKTIASNSDDATPTNFQNALLAGTVEKYRVESKLQNSLFGDVYLGKGLQTNRAVAIKTLDKSIINDKMASVLQPETPLAEVFLSHLIFGHPNVMTIIEVFELNGFHVVISEFAECEDLLEILRASQFGVPEYLSANLIRQATLGLEHLHSKQIALQDFSLENCLAFLNWFPDGQDAAVHIKVCDPGQATLFSVDNQGCELPVLHCGCIGKKFRPPEITTLTGSTFPPYLATKVDSWCLGWSTFYLICAIEIFESTLDIDACTRWSLFSTGQLDRLLHEYRLEQRLSPDALHFITSLLKKNPEERMTISEALRHPFLTSENALKQTTYSMLKDCIANNFIFDKTSNQVTAERRINPPFPIIPSIYFDVYCKQFCNKNKPSHSFECINLSRPTLKNKVIIDKTHTATPNLSKKTPDHTIKSDFFIQNQNKHYIPNQNYLRNKSLSFKSDDTRSVEDTDDTAIMSPHPTPRFMGISNYLNKWSNQSNSICNNVANAYSNGSQTLRTLRTPCKHLPYTTSIYLSSSIKPTGSWIAASDNMLLNKRRLIPESLTFRNDSKVPLPIQIMPNAGIKSQLKPLHMNHNPILLTPATLSSNSNPYNIHPTQASPLVRPPASVIDSSSTSAPSVNFLRNNVPHQVIKPCVYTPLTHHRPLLKRIVPQQTFITPQHTQFAKPRQEYHASYAPPLGRYAKQLVIVPAPEVYSQHNAFLHTYR